MNYKLNSGQRNYPLNRPWLLASAPTFNTTEVERHCCGQVVAVSAFHHCVLCWNSKEELENQTTKVLF